MHGGVAKDDLKNKNVDALKKGLVNLQRHIENVKKFGLPVAIAVNHFIKDTDKEVKASRVIGKLLIKNKIYFAGIDFVQEKLIGDINVTSPTGLTAYKNLSGVNLAKTFWNNI